MNDRCPARKFGSMIIMTAIGCCFPPGQSIADELTPQALSVVDAITQLPDPLSPREVSKLDGSPQFQTERCVYDKHLQPPLYSCWAVSSGNAIFTNAELRFFRKKKHGAAISGILTLKIATMSCVTVSQIESLFQRRFSPEPTHESFAQDLFQQRFSAQVLGYGMQPLILKLYTAGNCIGQLTLAR